MTMNDTATELAACPWCGENCANLVINQGDKWAHYEPSCLEVRTGYDLSETAAWRAEAIAAWNTRKETPTEQGEVARELEAIRPEIGWNKGDLYSHRYYNISSDLRDRILAALSHPVSTNMQVAEAVREAAAKVVERFPIRLDWPQTRLFEETAKRIRALDLSTFTASSTTGDVE